MRSYYRCADCLEVCALDNDGGLSRARCDCGGCLQFMGRVCVDRLVKDEVRCACDYRCIDAQGPVCSCKCGGENHGSGKVVEVVVDAGAVPIVRARWDLSERLRKVEAYRAAVAEAEKRIDRRTGGALSAMKAGQYVADKSAWWTATNAQKQLRHARELKVHKLRMAAIAKIAADTPARENITPASTVGALFV